MNINLKTTTDTDIDVGTDRQGWEQGQIHFRIWQNTDMDRDIGVRYHSGGSMELNARILLLAYMVYL
jgi:hypothetical protein